MNFKIISDSSSDITSLEGLAFESVPLKIITDEAEYVDSPSLDINGMIADLKKYKGTSRSSCPNAEEWTNAFGDADGIFCITITSGLSGSYNSALLALNEHLEAHPEKKGMVIDTLSVGPESTLIIEKLAELIAEGLEFEEIKEKIIEYKKTTHLSFCLESLRNLANNGRVSPAVAKIAGLLGIRMVGKASAEGTLELTNKVPGKEKAYSSLFKNMLAEGYVGGKVHIHHCQNPEGADYLVANIKAKFPEAKIVLRQTRALCSFYAESGGILVGFEGKSK